MTRIGIGVITMGKRELRPYLLGPEDEKRPRVFHVELDAAGAGIAQTRNACLRALCAADCDFIFMFDDDCWPTMAGWEDYFVHQHLRTGIHFMGLPEAFKSELAHSSSVAQGEIMYWRNIVGCFSFQSRRALEEVGGYNTAYARYGYEDDARNQRMRRAGMAGPVHMAYASPLRASAYIHSADVFGENPTPNMTQAEKMACIQANTQIWRDEVAGARLHYPI